MSIKKALYLYLAGTIGQITVTCILVFSLRSIGIELNYSTLLGMLAIGIGGTSSALWGIIVSAKYKKTTVKRILLDFINIKQSYSSYLLALVFLILDFCYVLIGGKFEIGIWYMPIVIFLKAIIFGGIEEIGWRYTFQPILEEKINYIFSTFITFLFWGVWHFLYFYIEGSLDQIQAGAFLLGLLTNCFILSALHNKTNSLWICAMTHALINTLSQISIGGSGYVSMACRGIIILFSIKICLKDKFTMKTVVYSSIPEYAKEIRQKVFVDEQGFNNELDSIDETAAHIVIFDGDKTPVAVCRIFWDTAMNTYILGRLAVIKEYRGKNIGSAMVKEAEKYIQKNGGKCVALHAQCRAAAFYQKLGFTEFGDIEDDEGCPHIWMKKGL